MFLSISKCQQAFDLIKRLDNEPEFILSDDYPHKNIPFLDCRGCCVYWGVVFHQAFLFSENDLTLLFRKNPNFDLLADGGELWRERLKRLIIDVLQFQNTLDEVIQ